MFSVTLVESDSWSDVALLAGAAGGESCPCWVLPGDWWWLPHLLLDFGSKCNGSYSIVDLEVFVSSLEFGHSEVKSVSPSRRSVTALLHESGLTSEVQSQAVASAGSALV